MSISLINPNFGKQRQVMGTRHWQLFLDTYWFAYFKFLDKKEAEGKIESQKTNRFVWGLQLNPCVFGDKADAICGRSKLSNYCWPPLDPSSYLAHIIFCPDLLWVGAMGLNSPRLFHQAISHLEREKKTDKKLILHSSTVFTRARVDPGSFYLPNPCFLVPPYWTTAHWKEKKDNT